MNSIYDEHHEHENAMWRTERKRTMNMVTNENHEQGGCIGTAEGQCGQLAKYEANMTLTREKKPAILGDILGWISSFVASRLSAFSPVLLLLLLALHSPAFLGLSLYLLLPTFSRGFRKSPAYLLLWSRSVYLEYTVAFRDDCCLHKYLKLTFILYFVTPLGEKKLLRFFFL